ncbi:hypothetical protein ACLB2K_046903 [Fragaria x ananassa]
MEKMAKEQLEIFQASSSGAHVSEKSEGDVSEPGEDEEPLVKLCLDMNPLFSAKGLRRMNEYHQRNSTLALYGLTNKKTDTLQMITECPKSASLLLDLDSSIGLKVSYQALHEGVTLH